MPDALPIPRDWDDLTPAWMTAALARDHPSIEVAEVELVLRDDGTNRRARVAITSGNGTGPATVFIKAADPEHAALNAKAGGLFNEANLFRSGVGLPIEHPAVHLVLTDEEGLDFLLVMEDVTARGGDPRDATRPLSIAEAADGVAGLARLHREFWGDRLAAVSSLDWVEPFTVWFSMGRGVDIGLERGADRIPAEVAALGGTTIDALWQRYIATFPDAPTTLIHGDAHIGNTYTLPGDRVGFLDWQVVHRGDPILDLGYFVQGALRTEDRMTAEADLVARYHDALELPSDEQPTHEGLWLRYRASVAHGLNVWLATAASTWQRPEVSLTLAERYAEAFLHLDTPGAITELERAR